MGRWDLTKGKGDEESRISKLESRITRESRTENRKPNAESGTRNTEYRIRETEDDEEEEEEQEEEVRKQKPYRRPSLSPLRSRSMLRRRRGNLESPSSNLEYRRDLTLESLDRRSELPSPRLTLTLALDLVSL